MSPAESLPALPTEGSVCFVCGERADAKLVMTATDPRPGGETQPTTGWHLRWCQQVELCRACVEVMGRDPTRLEEALHRDLVAAGLAEVT